MRATERLLAITNALGEAGTLTLTEIARAADLPKSTTLRFLSSLEPRGWVVHDGMGRYRLGPSILAAATRYLTTDPLSAAAAPHMRSLRDTVGETVSLSRVTDTARVCVREFASPQPLRLVLNLGAPRPLHAGASGLLLLAHLPAERRQDIYALGLTKFTPLTITDPDKLEAECERIRRRDWSMTRGQNTLGAVAIAVPVADHVQETMAALAIYGPEARFSERREQKIWLDLLLKTASAIEASNHP